MKKLFLLIVLMLAAVCLLASCDIYTYGSQGLEYTLSEDGSYYSVNKGTCTDTDIVIPSTYNGLPVKSIDYYAFKSCSSLTSIVIPYSVTNIAENAFADCQSLVRIYVSKINQNYKSINGNLYTKDGTKLIQYAIGKTNTTFTVPDSVTSIGCFAFMNCESLIYNEYDNALYLGNKNNPYHVLVKAKSSDITSCIIHPETKVLSDSAFNLCKSLTSIVIPDGVTSISDYAFEYCSSLTSVVIGDGVTSIGQYAFFYCSSLTTIDIPDGVTSIGDWAFFYCSSLTTIDIPDGVTSIGDWAFEYCKSLTSVEIPESVTSIGQRAFDCCESLTSIVIPDSVTSICDYTFYSCDSLTSIVIPDSVTSIGRNAFYSCDSLISIVIPDSVTSIGNYAFSRCNSLTDVYYEGSEAEWNKIAIGFNNTSLTNAQIHYNYAG